MMWLWIIGIIDLFIINSYIVQSIHDKQVAVGLIAIEILLFGIKDPIINLNFTVVTCIGLTIGAFGMGYGLDKKDKIVLFMQIISFIMQLGIRPEQTLLSIPYLTLIGITYILNQKHNRKVISLTYITCIALVVINYFVNQCMMQQNQQYYKFDTYTSLREQLCDYSIGQVSSEQLLQYIHDWMLFDTDTVNIQQMQQLVNQVSKNSELTLDTLINSAQSCYYAILVLLAAILIVKKYCDNNTFKLSYYLQLAGSLLIITYFYFTGRGADGLARVIKCCSYMCIPLLLLAAQEFKQDSKLQGKYLIDIDNKVQIQQLILVMVVCGTAGADIFNAASNSAHPYWGYSGTPVNMINVSDTGKYPENELNIMGMGLYDIIYIPGMQYRNEIYADDIRHIIPDGGTMYGQPEFIDYLSSIKIQNIAVALLNRAETYYVYESEPERLVDYYSDILGIDVDYEQVSDLKIPGYNLPRWRIFKRRQQ